MAARRGFTLVELLVVIAIIALLISILAPSLNAAKNIARQTICLTHHSAIGKSVMLYSEANRQMLPPYRKGIAVTNPMVYTIGYSYALATTYRFTSNSPGAPPALDAEGKPVPSGPLAFVHSLGMIEPDLMYCPLQNENDRWRRSTYPDPYGQVPAAGGFGGNYFSISYMFNPEVTAANSASEATYVYQKIDSMATNSILSMDIFLRTGSGYIVHTLGMSAESGQWAVLGPTGSVTLKASAAAYKHMKEANYWDLWPDYIAGFKLLRGN